MEAASAYLCWVMQEAGSGKWGWGYKQHGHPSTAAHATHRKQTA